MKDRYVRKTLERDVERRACEYAKKKGMLHYKFKSANNRGVPDRLFITKEGSVFFIEFKRPGVNKPDELQETVIAEMRKNHANVHFSNDLEHAKSVIDEMADPFGCTFDEDEDEPRRPTKHDDEL